MLCQWRKEIPCKRVWPPELTGHFFKRNDEVLFFFHFDRQVAFLAQNQAFLRSVCTTSNLEKPLPSSWYLFEESTPSYLLLNDAAGINLDQLEYTEQLPSDAAAFYLEQRKMALHQGILWQKETWCIKSKGQSSYICEHNGKLQWSFSGRAYPYTPIFYYHGHVYWGTAGNGGYFYLLSLEAGNVIQKIKTGGTAAIVTVDHFCYFVANMPSAKLLCVDLLSGNIVEEVPLKGKIEYSPLQLIDQQLHTITFEYKDGMPHKAWWNCVTL